FDYTKRIVSPEKKDDDPIILNFSVLKDYYACPHRFKISFLYGFMEPLFHLLGYGRSLHNIVMDMHKRWIDGEIIQPEQINGLIDRHFHQPYAGEKDTINMRKSAGRAISEYFDLFKGEAKDIIMSEQEIEIDLGNGVRVNGRMDLVKKKETSGEEKTYVVDFKTQTKPIADDVSEKQLKIYAIGYENLTGKNVDFIEIYNIDENKVMDRQHVDKADLESVKKGIIDAASNIKKNMFEKKMSKDNCKDCYKCNLCLDAKKKSEYGIKPNK
ncbi:MAG: PD-(D/E)XK nuclease family protein, partial [Eubacteriales bacterium]|nr:PD-(D/E)XK nuclease family protein [Eubacteriales bacterium]